MEELAVAQVKAFGLAVEEQDIARLDLFLADPLRAILEQRCVPW